MRWLFCGCYIVIPQTYLMEPLPRVFGMLQYFETICLQWKAFDLLNKMRYISWVVALLEACEITKMVPILAAILNFTKYKKSG